MFGNSKSLDKPGIRRDLLTMMSLSDDFKKNMFAKYGDGIIGKIHSNDLIDTVVESNESIPLFHKKMVSFTRTFFDINNQQKLMYGLTEAAAMRKFFYTNGRDFIFNNFQD